MALNSADMQENHPEDVDLVMALAALPGCQPGRSGTVFAARNSGLYISQDGGQSWLDALTQLGLSEPLPVTCLAAAPGPERVGEVFAGAPGCLLHSRDCGQTWRLVLLPSPPPTVSALAISPKYDEDETLFIGTLEDGLFITRDAGQTFVAWNFGLLDLNVICLAISPDFERDETIFAGTETGIFRSTNGGRAWREVDLPFDYDAVLSLALALDFSLDSGGWLYAGTESNGLWASPNGGESWRRLAENEIIDPVNAILSGPGGLAALTATGLFHSAGPEAAWQTLLAADEEDRQLVAVLNSARFSPAEASLVSYSDGSIAPIS